MPSKIFPSQSLKTRIPLITLLLLLGSLWILSFFATQMLRQDMERLLGEQQLSTTTILAAEINHELEGRIKSLERLSHMLGQPQMNSLETIQTFIDEHQVSQSLFNAGIIAYDIKGTAIADSIPTAQRVGINYMDVDVISTALREGKASIGHPVMGKQLKTPVFGMAAPVRNVQGQVIGALAGVINLGQPNFLDDISNSAYGKTGGYLLVSPQQRLIITATDKRRVMETLPAKGISPTLDQFIDTQNFTRVFVNPLGSEVLASNVTIPANGWYLATTLPTAEAFAPIYDMQQRMLLLTLLLTVVATGLCWWLVKRQLSPVFSTMGKLATLTESNEALQPLPILRQDEIGHLVSGFNRLLETLANRESALQDSEEKYRTLFREMLDGFALHEIILDADGAPVDYRFLEVNPAFERLTGLRAENIVGRTVLEVMPNTEQHWIKTYGKVALSGEPAFFENYAEALKKHFEVMAFRPAVRQFACIFSDVTARKKLEEVQSFLARTISQPSTESFFQELAQFLSTTLGMFYVCIDRLEGDGLKAQTLAIWCDDHFEDNVSYALKDTPCGDVVGNEVCCFPVGVCQCFPEDQVLHDLSAESYIGVTLWSHTGQPIGLIAVIGKSPLDDRTLAESILKLVAVRAAGELERLATEETLFESERRFRDLLSDVHLLSLMLDTQGRITFCNDFLLELTGWQREEVIDRNWFEVFLPADVVEKVKALFTESLVNGSIASNFENEILTRRGERLTIVWDNTVLRDEQGRIVGTASIGIDITDRKHAELELEQHRHHLAELVISRTVELVDARDVAEAANRAKSAFLANMSHEIRTPMNAILGMAHLLRRSGVTSAQADRLDKIDTAAEHLLALINDILDLSKIEAGKFRLDDLPLSINSLLGNVRSILNERAQAKHLTLAIESDRFPGLLRGDPTRLQQALLNYATNALKFTEHGSVTLRARIHDDGAEHTTIRFEVQDTGVGIAPDTVQRLFQAFEQADNSTTRKYGGTGLGLAITQRLAQLMGGEVGVDSVLGVGSTFWFTVCLKKADSQELIEPVRITNAEHLIRQRHAGKAVLIVDDEPVNLEVTQMFLEDSGLLIDTAEDGAEAVRKATATSYALILMDMQMPRQDGMEATQQIRELPGYRLTPILAMTANAFAEDKARCLTAGMNDFISKPFDPDSLFATLLRWLERKNTAP
ncbi:MAG: PAS domain S-box protein [Betaproteobacteria bacterium]